ncbi:MAG: cryptochrome/photolyase family protein [Roseiflexaceae bacterium]|nr:cryptochrome/photolyase family protein [Roseiflexaceae bacterium]
MPEQPLVWILGDQLLRDHPALAVAGLGAQVVLVESAARMSELPYQRKKLVLLLSAMRHYADDLRAQGYDVRYVRAANFTSGLREAAAASGATKLVTMAASEYQTRQLQQSLSVTFGMPVELLPNTQFLVEQHNPVPTAPRKIVMENFYRAMRRHFGVLLESDGSPTGGEWNYDKLNRQPLPKAWSAPAVLHFAPDEITREVIGQIGATAGLGTAEDFDLAVTHADAERAFQHFLDTRLAQFGPYEDAMSSRSRTLYHSLLSPYMNIGLLDPLAMVRAAEACYREGRAPLNSVEGFVRQILGWREFMYWQYWQQMPGLRSANSWNASRPMPQMFWDGQSDMNCIHNVATGVIETGYSHHIERLMVVCNFCLLAGIDPAAVADWFLACYFDAYDWVVLPNVIGMGLNADGGLIGTKPYIASANYINKMSDYCGSCRYNPKQRSGADACPFNFLYWNFLIANEPKLRANPRSGPAVLGLAHLDAEQRAAVQAQTSAFLAALAYYS